MPVSISCSFPNRGRCKNCGAPASEFRLTIIQLDGLAETPDRKAPLLQADWTTNRGQGTSDKLNDKILRHVPFNDYSPRLHRTIRGNSRYPASWQSTDYYRCGKCGTLYWAVRDDGFIGPLTKGSHYYEA